MLRCIFRSISDTKMTAFFQNNFTQDKWKKSAQKNAYLLMGKQRFKHAAAFFLLGGDLKVAVEVISIFFLIYFILTSERRKLLIAIIT